MAETKNIKDYSGKNHMEWFSERRWKGFLMRMPIRKRKKMYQCENANDTMSIRATASKLNHNDACDRRFEVDVDFERKTVNIVAIKKEQ